MELHLQKKLLHDLKKAGVFGFTFHIDSRQGRGRGPQWEGKNELELNELRLYYAKMVAAEGGMACSFNSTVYDDTLHYVPGVSCLGAKAYRYCSYYGFYFVSLCNSRFAI